MQNRITRAVTCHKYSNKDTEEDKGHLSRAYCKTSIHSKKFQGKMERKITERKPTVVTKMSHWCQNRQVDRTNKIPCVVR